MPIHADRMKYNRAVEALKFRQHAFAEIAGDQRATNQAVAIVFITCLAAAAGANGLPNDIKFPIQFLQAFASFFVTAYLVNWGGHRWLHAREEPESLPRLWRAMGFATLPNLLVMLDQVPGPGMRIATFAGLWSLILTVVAIKAALGLETVEAIAAFLIGAAPVGIVTLAAYHWL